MDSDSGSDSAVSDTIPQTPLALEKQYISGGRKSLSGIAIRSFCLGTTLASSLIALVATLLFTASPLWRLPFFFAALSTFHFLEFWTTAEYSTADATIKSFLLTANWPAYAIAHSSASAECLLTNLFLTKTQPGGLAAALLPPVLVKLIMLIGIFLVILGQTIRSTAMIEAGPSFNHIVQHRKRHDHTLITSGVYSHLRHPSYFGFFWWAVGTQLVLGNTLCLAGYVAVLWKFFSARVKAEEASLVRFFGRDYVEYKKRVGTKMPFIG